MCLPLIYVAVGLTRGNVFHVAFEAHFSLFLSSVSTVTNKKKLIIVEIDIISCLLHASKDKHWLRKEKDTHPDMITTVSQAYMSGMNFVLVKFVTVTHKEN